jgi:hypothetical protein
VAAKWRRGETEMGLRLSVTLSWREVISEEVGNLMAEKAVVQDERH